MNQKLESETYAFNSATTEIMETKTNASPHGNELTCMYGALFQRLFDKENHYLTTEQPVSPIYRETNKMLKTISTLYLTIVRNIRCCARKIHAVR